MSSEIANPYLELLDSKDPFQFWRGSLALVYKNKINYADFSRKAGISKSYLSDLLSEKKGFSRDTLNKIKVALKIPKKYQKVFELLVLKKYPQLRLKGQSESYIQENLSALIKQLKTQTGFQEASKGQSMSNLSKKRDVFRVYAALGGLETGATLTEIADRTGMDKRKILSIVNDFIAVDLVHYNTEKYYVYSTQADMWNNNSTTTLPLLLDDVFSQLASKSSSLINNKKNILFHTALSMNTSDIQKFNEELKTTIFELMDKYQNDEGNCVRELSFAFYND